MNKALVTKKNVTELKAASDELNEIRKVILGGYRHLTPEEMRTLWIELATIRVRADMLVTEVNRTSWIRRKTRDLREKLNK